ncbi:MAG: hypothetical protein LBG90_04475, partial [Spirochaetaceae bacterium]|nr:hypothetical protein [Spirochaetaceae bacterium]
EAQVFLDIHEVEDSPQGHWARLNWELNGRGAPDIYAALEDLRLAGLYAGFLNLLKESVAVLASEKSFSALEKSAGSFSAREKYASLTGAVEEFAVSAERYLTGGDGAYDPFPGTFAAGKDAERKAETVTLFFGYIERFLGLGKMLENLPALDSLGKSLFSAQTQAAAAGYMVLALLRRILGKDASGAAAAALMDHWRLGRKLREAFAGFGLSGDESSRAAELMRLILSRTLPEQVPPLQSANPAENLILGYYKSEDFRRVLGVNRFEDTIWFNKEAFETALRYIPLFTALESPSAFEKPKKGKKPADSKMSETQGRKWLKSIAEITGAFAEAEAPSEYRLEGLIEALGAKSGPKKKPGKKENLF